MGDMIFNGGESFALERPRALILMETQGNLD